MTTHRDARNYSKGYQAAMLDLADALDRGGIEDLFDWMINNTTDEATRNRINDRRPDGPALDIVT